MKSLITLGALSTLLASLTAQAQTGYPDEYVLRPLNVSAGMAQLRLPVVINASKGSAGKPINIPPALEYGVSENLQVALYHVRGVCLGEKEVCDPVYNDVAFGLVYSFMTSGELQAVALAAVEAWDLKNTDQQPLKLHLPAGVGFKYISNPMSLTLEPQIVVALNHRGEGNDDEFRIPFEAAYQIDPQLAFFATSGLFGRDEWAVPIGFGLNFLLHHGLDVGGEFRLNNPKETTDARQLIFYLNWRS